MPISFCIAGDRAVSVQFGNEISMELNKKVRLLQKNLQNKPIAGITETVPTYSSLIVHYRPEILLYQEIVEILEERAEGLDASEEGEVRKEIIKEIPILYGGEGGPDLKECAQLEETSPEEIVRKHSEHLYYVYMLGFAPGHPYMARFEEPFRFKRRVTPRVSIPERSIVVQLNLSDMIPFRQPCGWNIIGMTPLAICDFTREDPFLVHAGDWVRHYPINKREYDLIRRDVEQGIYRVQITEKERVQDGTVC